MLNPNQHPKSNRQHPSGFSDFYATFAELAGVKPPRGFTIDGRSLAPQLQAKKGSPREWAHVQLGANWYVKERRWKMNQAGELYNMKEAPFEEKSMPADSQDTEAAAAGKRQDGNRGRRRG